MTWVSAIITKLQSRRLGVKLSSLRGFSSKHAIKVESPCRLADVQMSNSNTLTVGAHSYIRSGTEFLHISRIGRYCSIGRNVTLGQDPRNHPVDWLSSSPRLAQNYKSNTAPLEVGHDVWVGHRATIMAGIKIGNGAIVGCDSVVTKDVPPFAIVAGNPAKLIRYRFDTETISHLQSLLWWNRSFNDLQLLDFSRVEHCLKELAQSSPAPVRYPSVHFLGKKIIKREGF